MNNKNVTQIIKLIYSYIEDAHILIIFVMQCNSIKYLSGCIKQYHMNLYIHFDTSHIAKV